MSVTLNDLVVVMKVIDRLERRIEALEKNSHAPVDLTPFIEREVTRQLQARGIK